MFDGFVSRCDIGTPDGPVVAIKDTIDVAGLPTRAGCAALDASGAATRHASVVEAVLAAGCRIVGKAATHELAFGMTGVNDWAGTPINPKFPDLVPGGSSSGPACLVAAGSVDFAIGTDTGGSIRLPAACCGIYGLKPTFGRIDRRGVSPTESSLDCVGPMAASIEALIAGMGVMDPQFGSHVVPATLPVLAIPGVLAEPEITIAVSRMVAKAACALRPVELRWMDEAFSAGLVIIGAEAWRAFGHLLDTGSVGVDVAERLRRAALLTSADVAAAEKVRTRFTAEVDRVLADADALVLPTMPGFPLPLKDALRGETDLGASRLVRPFNLSGHPALTIPLPAPLPAPLPVAGGRPVGLQLVGRRGEDAELCALGRRFAAAMTADRN